MKNSEQVVSHVLVLDLEAHHIHVHEAIDRAQDHHSSYQKQGAECTGSPDVSPDCPVLSLQAWESLPHHTAQAHKEPM